MDVGGAMKTVLITGANRGLGLEFVKQYAEKGFNVIACCRKPESADDLNRIVKSSEQVEIQPLDVLDDQSIDHLYQTLSDRSIDILINNAGTSGEQGVTLGNIHKVNFMKVFETNCYAVVKISDSLLPLVAKSETKLIVAISSRMGSISDNDRGRSYAYRSSKAALNAVMRSFAIDVKPQQVNVLLMHPGWVRTDMGGKEGLISAEESVTAMISEFEKHGVKSSAECLRRYDGEIIHW